VGGGGEGGGCHMKRIGGNRSEYGILTGGWMNTKERSECGWEDNAATDLTLLYL